MRPNQWEPAHCRPLRSLDEQSSCEHPGCKSRSRHGLAQIDPNRLPCLRSAAWDRSPARHCSCMVHERRFYESCMPQAWSGQQMARDPLAPNRVPRYPLDSRCQGSHLPLEGTLQHGSFQLPCRHAGGEASGRGYWLLLTLRPAGPRLNSSWQLSCRQTGLPAK